MADLIDRGELLRKICGNECGSVCDEECENAMCNFYDYIMDAPIVNRWIPCNERLPEIDKDVIVFYPHWRDNPIQVAHLNYDKLTFELSDGEYNIATHAVTHWMSLPRISVRRY